MADYQWSVVRPEGCLSADGKPWAGAVRWGNPDKVALVFQGGGISINSEMDAHPDCFFFNHVNPENLIVKNGIFSSDPDNPFSCWTLLFIPYASGDFHCGRGRNIINGSGGKEKTVYHEGYLNYRRFMDTVVPRLKKKPEQLLITGFSGGGFATALLSDDVITNYFPNVKNITSCIDSAHLWLNGWKDIAVSFWKSPVSISDFLVSDDIAMDGIRNIVSKHPDCKVLYCGSCMDCILIKFNAYLLTGVMPESPGKYGKRFREYLKKFCDELGAVPNTGVFIFDKYRSVPAPEFDGLTPHTIEIDDAFFAYRQEGKSVAEWIIDAVETDKVRNIGLELLD